MYACMHVLTYTHIHIGCRHESSERYHVTLLRMAAVSEGTAIYHNAGSVKSLK